MRFSGAAVAYATAGGLIAYSGIKGATIADTVKHVLQGNLNVSNTETISAAGKSSGSGSVPAGNTGASGNSAEANQALAKKLAISMGLSSWTTGQTWDDWVSLWNQESGWNASAENPTSGAYGIPQALPADKMASAGSDWKTNPATQIRWGIGYIQGRYGSPVMAWAHEVSNNWY